MARYSSMPKHAKGEVCAVRPTLPRCFQKKYFVYPNRPAHALRTMQAHVYSAAEQSYRSLVNTGINQSLVICGESGCVCMYARA